MDPVSDEWTQYAVTAQIPPDANLIRSGVFLNGGGQVEFRHPALHLIRQASNNRCWPTARVPPQVIAALTW